ncbi:MAG: hypothetical protein WD002_07105 [Pseudomonadales bacterium]
MALQRLEIYVDSYSNTPFVKDFEDTIELSRSDEKQLEDWIRSTSGRQVRIDQNLRIEDIKHSLLNVAQDHHATRIRVSIVD